MSIEMEEPERPEEGSVGKAERASVLAKRIVEALGPYAKDFQTDGVAVGGDGPRLVLYNGDADLLEIVLYAVDERRHIVFRKALGRTYHTILETFVIYDDDESLVQAMLPELRKMLGVLSRLGGGL